MSAFTELSIGWIPYLNLLPMHFELSRVTRASLALKKGHPTSVNRWLLDGQVSVAPSSSVNLLQSLSLEIAVPLGVASLGAVQSVYLGFRREHLGVYDYILRQQNQIASFMQQAVQQHRDNARAAAAQIWNGIKGFHMVENFDFPLIFTAASATSVALTKILMKLWFGERQLQHIWAKSETQTTGNCFVRGDRAVELVIGDEALVRRHEFHNIIDLGSAWLQLTALPFVFAVWQTTMPQAMKELGPILRECAEVSQARMRVEPDIYYPEIMPLDGAGKPIDLASYWKVVHYKFQEPHFRSLLLFLSLYSQMLANQETKAPERVEKWADQWTSG